jgi:NSS family neurotransmitter:Na+ symporter
MNNYGLLVVGIIECIAIGYFYNTKEMREYANSKSDFTIGPWWDFCIKYLTPIVVGILFLTNIVDRVRTSYGGYSRLAEFLGGWLILIVFIGVAIILYKRKGKE